MIFQWVNDDNIVLYSVWYYCLGVLPSDFSTFVLIVFVSRVISVKKKEEKKINK